MNDIKEHGCKRSKNVCFHSATVESNFIENRGNTCTV